MNRTSPPARSARRSAVLAPVVLAGALLALEPATVVAAPQQAQPEQTPGATPEEKPKETVSPRGRRRVLLQSERYEREYAVPEHAVGGLRIEGANGSVRIRSADRTTIGVTALVDALTRERAQGAQPLLEERGEEHWLVLRIDWPEERDQPEAVSWEVEVPRTLVGFDIETTGGVVSLNGLAGDAMVRTTVGDVIVENQAGGVDAETSNARLLITNPGGDVIARTTHALIKVTGAPALVDARTRMGAIDVRLAADSPGPVRLETEAGAIELIVGPGFAGSIDLSTDGAEAVVDAAIDASQIERDAPGHAVVRFGEGAPSLAATTSAAIRLLRRD